MATDSINELSLADWRRRVATLYADVRRLHATDPDAALETWRRERERLFVGHVQSPVAAEHRGSFKARHFPIDPALRFEVPVLPDTPTEPLARPSSSAAGPAGLAFAAPLISLPVSSGGLMG